MSPDQRKMLFAEWRKCWTAIVATRAGSYPADEKAARMAITAKVVGHEKSWGAVFGQREIDRLLAVLWAISRGGDFNAQMRQVNQPFTRAEHSVFASHYLDALEIEAHGREAYLNGIARRIHKCELADINDEQWLDVLAALNHTRMHKLGIKHSHPRSEWQNGKRRSEDSASFDLGSAAPATETHSRTGEDPAYVPPENEPF